ncbi:hypothetical protein ABZZ74_44075 [Streptomyces sp. NPDC006476]|uniref:hypothetical protein n=1 Tax=Streptomyces sp. NPDC006476 TaxID=3157175 RepID=UPI0010D56409
MPVGVRDVGAVVVGVSVDVPLRWAGTTSARSPGGDPSATVPAAEANRSSNVSAAGVGPVSSVESSYSCPHQSSS